MKIIRGLPEKEREYKNPILTLGNFDGVHLGHQEIFKRVVKRAKEIEGTSIAITFDPHPLKILAPEKCPSLITNFKEKAEILESFQIDILFSIPFTREFSSLDADDFIKKIVVDKIGPKELFIGYDFAFGKGREGDTSVLKGLGESLGFKVTVVKPIRVGEKTVSSTLIRNLIKEGNVKEASVYLGRPYSISGEVIKGHGRGKGLGFPTANINFQNELIPSEGVYIGEILFGEERHKSLINVGTNPTFGEDKLNVEVFILDFGRDIYGEFLKVFFQEKIRGEIRFKTPEQLIVQMQKDLKQARDFFHNRRS
ncbi:MAG: riboflavin biosynthesis protein RibF [Candidatus Schekmanbacteria bacterium RBG_16_38_11]|uniref:Riboflavin biosynthesis protein n=1 Tax=Candidatus Schekmanbacteria bacterium RBG_16_38_11 TaxID=1817880 RepID=A0A1F7RWZ3_9BACT|nr:MAG: riboflavin biosynthesis protein RibF [Candidatus Schekmanbacteria bacterium RBG_16_38_11]